MIVVIKHNKIEKTCSVTLIRNIIKNYQIQSVYVRFIPPVLQKNIFRFLFKALNFFYYQLLMFSNVKKRNNN
jgi:hypothetical protein